MMKDLFPCEVYAYSSPNKNKAMNNSTIITFVVEYKSNIMQYTLTPPPVYVYMLTSYTVLPQIVFLPGVLLNIKLITARSVLSWGLTTALLCDIPMSELRGRVSPNKPKH